MPSKPFNDAFKVHEPSGFTVLNGEQVTKIVGRHVGGEWKLTFHLSDATTYTIDNAEWNNSFIAEVFPEALQEQP